MAEGKRPVTFRTRKLSPPAPMVLHPGGCGRVGHRRTSSIKGHPYGVALNCFRNSVLSRGSEWRRAFPASWFPRRPASGPGTARSRRCRGRPTRTPRSPGAVPRRRTALHDPAQVAGGHLVQAGRPRAVVGDELEQRVQVAFRRPQQRRTPEEQDAVLGRGGIACRRRRRSRRGRCPPRTPTAGRRRSPWPARCRRAPARPTWSGMVSVASFCDQIREPKTPSTPSAATPTTSPAPMATFRRAGQLPRSLGVRIVEAEAPIGTVPGRRRHVDRLARRPRRGREDAVFGHARHRSPTGWWRM